MQKNSILFLASSFLAFEIILSNRLSSLDVFQKKVIVFSIELKKLLMFSLLAAPFKENISYSLSKQLNRKSKFCLLL